MSCCIAATRSASGLLEWSDPSQALDAISACNHYVIRDAGMPLFVFVSQVVTVDDLRTDSVSTKSVT